MQLLKNENHLCGLYWRNLMDLVKREKSIHPCWNFPSSRIVYRAADPPQQKKTSSRTTCQPEAKERYSRVFNDLERGCSEADAQIKV